MKKKHIIVSVLLVSLFCSAGVLAREGYSDYLPKEVEEKVGWWDRIKEALIATLSKIDDMIFDRPSRYADNVFDEGYHDPDKAFDSTDKYVDSWLKTPDRAKFLAEEGIEELSGPVGTIKEGKDFIDRVKNPESSGGSNLGGSSSGSSGQKKGLDADFLREKFEEIDEDRLKRADEAVSDIDTSLSELPEDFGTQTTPSSPTKTKQHPCNVDKNSPACKRIIKKAVRKGLRKGLGSP